MSREPRTPGRWRAQVWSLRGWVTVFLATLLATLPALPLWADGTQTGVIAGLVRDSSGVLLQGVVVEAVGARGSRQAVTDAEGRYRFPALEAGSYTVRASLLELMAEARDVSVFLGRSHEVDLVLESEVGEAPEAEIDEWIQVIAEAPVIDRFKTQVGANVAFELIDELPVERFYQSVALLLPGVAGGEDGNPNTSGSLRSSNAFLVDGVDTTDPTTGLFGLNLSYEAVQEVQVTTASPGVEQGRGTGAVINVVTRSGGNRYRGGVRWVSGGGDLRGDFDDGPDRRHLRRGLAAANSGPSNPDATVSLNLGGPLLRDRLWFFAAHQDSDSGFLRPTLQGPTWDQDGQVEASAFKLNWHPTGRQTLVAQHTRDQADFVSFNPFSRNPSELQLPQVPSQVMLENDLFQPLAGEIFALEDNEQSGHFSKLAWTLARGQNFSLGVTLAEQDRDLARGARNSRGLTSDAPHIGGVVDFDPDDPNDLGEFLLFLFNGVTEEGAEQRPRQQADVVAETLIRRGGFDHELSFGFDYQETESSSELNVAGADGIDPFLGIPVAGQLYIDFDLSPECLFFDQCQPFDPATGVFQPFTVLNFWRRPARETREQTAAFYVSDTLVNERWVIDLGLRWEFVDGEDQDGRTLVDDQDIAPRVAVTYDPKGNGETVLSFSWGRYLEPFLQQYLDALNRPEPLSGYTEYDRLDFVGNLDCSTVDPSILDSPCWELFGTTPFFPILPSAGNQSLERSVVTEWVAGYERQVTPELGLSLHWVDRTWDDLWNGVETFDPLTGTFAIEVQNLPEAERTYRALQVLLQKRFANRWQLLASYTWSEAEGNFFRADGQGSLGDLANFIDTNVVNRLGPAPYDRPHQLGVFATVRWPLGRSQLTVGSALRYRDGVPFERRTFEDFGIRFLTPRGSERLDGTFQLDLAVTWDLRMASQLELEVKGEVFNVTDEQEIQAVETLVDTRRAGLPRTIDDIQTPRTLRFTLGLRF